LDLALHAEQHHVHEELATAGLVDRGGVVRERREGARDALAVALVAGHAVGGVDAGAGLGVPTRGGGGGRLGGGAAGRLLAGLLLVGRLVGARGRGGRGVAAGARLAASLRRRAAGHGHLVAAGVVAGQRRGDLHRAVGGARAVGLRRRAAAQA